MPYMLRTIPRYYAPNKRAGTPGKSDLLQSHALPGENTTAIPVSELRIEDASGLVPAELTMID